MSTTCAAAGVSRTLDQSEVRAHLYNSVSVNVQRLDILWEELRDEKPREIGRGAQKPMLLWMVLVSDEVIISQDPTSVCQSITAMETVRG